MKSFTAQKISSKTSECNEYVDMTETVKKKLTKIPNTKIYS